MATISAARNNNLVAESDLQAAVAALKEKLERKADATDDAVQRKLLVDCSNSLSYTILSAVQPVSDEAFHVYLSQYKDDKLTPPSDESESLVEPESPTLPTDFEFEEEELMDQQAEQRVQELRNQVRAKAAKIQSLRASTLDRAVAVAERQVKLWIGPANTVASNGSNKVDTAALLEQHRTAVDDMKTSLAKMTEALEETGTSLPQKLQSFQATLNEIQSSLEKNPERPSSQIEKAIYSREEQNSEEDTTAEIQQLPPAEQLANLLCRD